jgi:alpha-galactosidase
MKEVMELLSRGTGELRSREVTQENFLTVVVQSLNWDHGAHITSIDNDQWSAVTAERYDGTVRYYVECDQVEHGVAAIWKAFAEAPSGRAS